jgi:hypothetical protein
LATWCHRLDVPPLPPAMLAQQGLQVLTADDVGAGFVLSRTGPVAGLAYAVPGTANPAVLWADVVALAGRLHPARTSSAMSGATTSSRPGPPDLGRPGRYGSG